MAEIDDQEFEDEFSTFGVTISDTTIFNELRHLCQMHRLSCDEIVCEWLAFSQNKNNAKLNQEMLEAMDRERLSKKQNKSTKTPSNTRIQGKSSNLNILEGIGDAVDSVLDSYTTPNNKINSNKRQHTPDNPINKRLTSNGRNPVPFSPASFSPTQSATPSRNFSTRSNAGQVVCSWGTADNTKWTTMRETSPAISPENSSAALTNKFKYMFQKLSDKAHILSDMIDEMGEYLKKKHNIQEDFAHLSLPVQESVPVIGRVCCDTVGKLNAKSVMLEGSRETSGGHLIPLDLSEVQQFSLFPGQVIAAEGINTTGNKFIAKKIQEGLTLPFSENPVDLKEGPLSLVIAAGPFTTSDSIMYEPLTDLVKYLHKDTPDVCILMGPFVDSKQPNIEESITEMSFELFFQEKIVKVLVDATSRLKTKLVFVPSYRDIHHEYVYPQPPFNVRVDTKQKVQFVSDPCTLNIEGVIFGITSTDVLFHLGQEETSSATGGDRLTRLTQHILTQHNYYPLHPPHDDVNVDYDHFELYSHMPCTPHVFILPSDLRYFIKDIQGCCCINPGRLSKGQVGGTYARLVIQPGNSTNVPSSSKSISSQISAQVLRI